MDLKNKVIVITGGSKGLGKALALAFCKEGSEVIISARSKEDLQKTAQDIKATPYTGDVTKEADMKKLAAFAVKRFKKLDIWVNNAGTTLPHSPIEAVNAKRAHDIMETNFFGTFYGCRAAMKIMKKQESGIILNIVSMSALVGRPLSSVYAASRWATRGFTESLSLALRPYKIPVYMVHPGGIKTTIFGKAGHPQYAKFMDPGYVASKIIRNIKRKNPKTEIIIDK